MKRFVFAIMLVLAIGGSATVTVSAAGPRPTQPVTVLPCSQMSVCPTAVR